MQKVQASVKRFMELAKQPVLDKPGIPDEATRLLGMRLVAEEAFFELAEALGIELWHDCGSTIGGLNRMEFAPDKEPNLTEIADAIGDGLYVLLWLANACGIDMAPVMGEICRSNLTKFQDGHSFAADGKLNKSPLYSPANISAVIQYQQEPTKIVCDLDWKAEKMHRFACDSKPLVYFLANLQPDDCNEESQYIFGSWWTVEHREAVFDWSIQNPEHFIAEFELYYGRKP